MPPTPPTVYNDATSSARTFEQINHILSSAPHPTSRSPAAAASFKPAAVNPAALLPNLLAASVKRRHAAQQAALACQPDDDTIPQRHEREDHAHARAMLTPRFVRDAMHALQHLHRHYELLLANPARVRDALSGYDSDTVVWLPPDAQRDFEAFVSALWNRWAASSVQPTCLHSLLQWATNPNIDRHLLQADVNSSVCAYQSIEHAFQTFHLALENMIELHDS